MSKISQYPEATTLANVKLLGNQSNVTKQIPATLFQPASTVKVWRGLISQVSNNAPTAVVLEDTIGDSSFVFGISDVGVFNLTDSGNNFTADKTFVTVGTPLVGFFKAQRISETEISLLTFDDAVATANDIIFKVELQILVYP